MKVDLGEFSSEPRFFTDLWMAKFQLDIYSLFHYRCFIFKNVFVYSQLMIETLIYIYRELKYINSIKPKKPTLVATQRNCGIVVENFAYGNGQLTLRSLVHGIWILNGNYTGNFFPEFQIP